MTGEYGCDLKKNNAEVKSPFVIKCISEQCTVVHAGVKIYTADALQDAIDTDGNIPGSFGFKLKQARDEVAAL